MKLYTGILNKRFVYAIEYDEATGTANVTVAAEGGNVIDKFIEPFDLGVPEKIIRHAVTVRILTDHEE